MPISGYLQVFIDESQEHVQRMNEHLLQLNKNPGDISLIEDVFRSAHTLKGMAATMEYHDLTKLTHTMENVLDLVRNEAITANAYIFDHIFNILDALEGIIQDITEGGTGKKDIANDLLVLETITAGIKEGSAAQIKTPIELQKYGEFERMILGQAVDQGLTLYEITIILDEGTQLKAARVLMVFRALGDDGEVIKANPTVDQLEKEKFDLTFMISLISKRTAADLEQKIMKVSEIAYVHIHPIDGLYHELRSVNQEEKTLGKTQISRNNRPQRETNRMVRVNIDRLDTLMNVFEEFIIDRGRLERISQELKNPELNETVERMNRTSGELQDIILNIRMMPIEFVFNRFPRMVRRVSKELGKQVTMVIEGAETELDRVILDEIGNPLVHLLRNSIDHGIESPSARVAAGKNEEGMIRLSAYHSDHHVCIEVEDDGAGINKKKVVKRALDQGIVSEKEVREVSDQELYGLLFSSGFSTAESVTSVSGRGVGLDVVRQTIESLGGMVKVDSDPGRGSIFTIQLPWTL